MLQLDANAMALPVHQESMIEGGEYSVYPQPKLRFDIFERFHNGISGFLFPHLLLNFVFWWRLEQSAPYGS